MEHHEDEEQQEHLHEQENDQQDDEPNVDEGAAIEAHPFQFESDAGCQRDQHGGSDARWCAGGAPSVCKQLVSFLHVFADDP